jgi:hypothetical protein
VRHFFKCDVARSLPVSTKALLGGNFLHSGDVAASLGVHALEGRTRLAQKFRFPFYSSLMPKAASTKSQTSVETGRIAGETHSADGRRLCEKESSQKGPSPFRFYGLAKLYDDLQRACTTQFDVSLKMTMFVYMIV